MGWGYEPHEGYPARLLRDASLTSEWSAATTAQATGWIVVCCSCGWRGGHYRDHDEAEEERAYTEWRYSHMAPLIDPEPDRVLVLGRDGGGARHFLTGRPVQAGTRLELRVADDVWVPIRYEWSWRSDERPRAYLALGACPGCPGCPGAPKGGGGWGFRVCLTELQRQRRRRGRRRRGGPVGTAFALPVCPTCGQTDYLPLGCGWRRCWQCGRRWGPADESLRRPLLAVPPGEQGGRG